MRSQISYDDLCRVVAEAYYELNAEGWELPPATQLSLPCQQQRRSSILPAELFAGDSYLRAAEGALRRIRCLPQLAAALAWMKDTSPQQARDLNRWLDRLHFYVERRIPLSEFQQQLDQWVQIHQVVVDAFQATVWAPARPPSGAADAGVDAHGQLPLWPAEDFAPPAAGQAVQEQGSSGDGRSSDEQ